MAKKKVALPRPTNDTQVKALGGFTPDASGIYVWTGFAVASGETMTMPQGVAHYGIASPMTPRENPANVGNICLIIGDESYTYGSGSTQTQIGTAGVATTIKQGYARCLMQAAAIWKAVAVGA